MLEQAILTLAKQRFEAFKALAANHIDFQDVRDCFYELTGLTSIRMTDGANLSPEVIDELILIDNLAVLTMRSVNPDTLNLFPVHAVSLSEYLDMSDRMLVDLIFKEGGRFNNQDAISVAIHRGLIDSVKNQAEAYERVTEREEANNWRAKLDENHAHVKNSIASILERAEKYDWSEINREVRGHPYGRLLREIEFLANISMQPEHRKELFDEMRGLAKKLSDLNLITAFEIEEIFTKYQR